jgi:hypothetical protein
MRVCGSSEVEHFRGEGVRWRRNFASRRGLLRRFEWVNRDYDPEFKEFTVVEPLEVTANIKVSKGW